MLAFAFRRTLQSVPTVAGGRADRVRPVQRHPGIDRLQHERRRPRRDGRRRSSSA